MNIRKFATISVLVISSFAATNVAPTKAELEAMYNKAFREFSAANYDQALKELDAIDARQPDLAESQNLRGVIEMRQGQYDQAEAALEKALATDPKFWNARFNLAEIPFLRKDWAEARKRFEGLLQSGTSELQGDAAQLIQYKILLTYLLEGKENMVDSILAKFELTPDTPAVTYSNAAIAFQRKNDKEAKDLITGAEKKFSPALNKLFAESFYEVGWMEKPAGQTRVALELTTAAEKAQKAKAIAQEKFEAAEQAFQQRDYTAAKKLIDEADATDPNQPATINLRGEILLAQTDFDGAENAFKQAAKIDPKFREAQYNLAQVPFKKKEYTKARDRFEALFNNTPSPGGDKNQAAQIIKFKIFLTLLLEGKDSRAQKMMEQFQFTGDTPALYYAQAAWEFKHSNAPKANDWIVSAKKIYSPALNMVFADSFYDVGWLQPTQNVASEPVSPSKEIAKNETAPPSIEPSPIPAPALTLSKQPKAPEILPKTIDTAATQPLAKNEKTQGPFATNSPSVEMPSAANALPSETRAPLPKEPETTTQAPPSTTTEPVTSNAVTQQSPATSPANKEPVAPATNVVSTPATVLAPSTVDSSKAVASEGFNPQTLLFAVLLGAGILILLWVGYTEFRRRVSVSAYSPAPATGPDFDSFETETTVEKLAAPKRLAGGPPQVSLHLKASEPSVRRAAVPFSKPNRPFGTNGGVTTVGPVVESFVPRAPAPAPAPVVERIEKPIVEPITDVTPEPEKPAFVEPVFEPAEEADEFSSVGEPQVIEEPARAVEAIPAIEEMPAAREELVITEAPFFAETPAWTQPAAPEPEPVWAPITQEPAWTPVAFEPSAPVFETPAPVFETPEPIFEAPAPEPVAETEALFESVSEPVVIEPEAAPEPIAEFSPVTEEPVAQGPPIPYQVPAFETDSPMAEITKPEPEELPAHLAKGVVAGTSMAGVGALRHSVESPSFAPKVISTEPLAQQPTTPATMPQPNQPTPAPSIRPSPMAGGAPQMQTSGM
ncbi:MAG TPA: tetratricopeptide repeat protein, partial [Chthoniobacterales bacterium]|nr:tetratricopeptide repeat protein [Chthoniobacterales bacterium]